MIFMSVYSVSYAQVHACLGVQVKDGVASDERIKMEMTFPILRDKGH